MSQLMNFTQPKIIRKSNSTDNRIFMSEMPKGTCGRIINVTPDSTCNGYINTIVLRTLTNEFIILDSNSSLFDTFSLHAAQYYYVVPENVTITIGE